MPVDGVGLAGAADAGKWPGQGELSFGIDRKNNVLAAIEGDAVAAAAVGRLPGGACAIDYRRAIGGGYRIRVVG